MFDELADQGPTAGDRLLGLVASAIRTTWSRVALGSLAIALGLTSIGAAWAVQAVGPEPCMELRQAEFNLDELIATKDKVLAYERDPVGELVLSGKEASFVLADNLKFPVWIETRGQELFVEYALPQQERCYNIVFQGTVEVKEGAARIVPSQVQVGQLDLSLWLAGKEILARPDDVENDEARQLLSQMRHLRVENDEVHVAVTDPRSLR